MPYALILRAQTAMQVRLFAVCRSHARLLLLCKCCVDRTVSMVFCPYAVVAMIEVRIARAR